MALINKKLTDRNEASEANLSALIHIVDPSDITDSAQGSSYKISKSNFLKDIYEDGGANITVNNPVTSTETSLDDALEDINDAIPSAVVVTELAGATTYTTVLADQVVRSTSTSNVTVTIPANATVAYPIGKRIEFIKSVVGSDGFTLVGAGGVTFESPSGLVTKGGRKITIVKIDTNIWRVDLDFFELVSGRAQVDGFSLSSNQVIRAGQYFQSDGGIYDTFNTVSFIPTYDAKWTTNKHIVEATDQSANYTDLSLINRGSVKAMLSTVQNMLNANITPSVTTTRLQTTVDLTAHRTVTLPTINGSFITVIDAKQTIYKNISTPYRIIVAVASGKTLNGVTNGVAYLGQKGQSITFYHDGIGNYTYATVDKECVYTATKQQSSGFDALTIVKNTTTVDFNTSTDLVRLDVGEYDMPNYNDAIHTISGVYGKDYYGYAFLQRGHPDFVAGGKIGTSLNDFLDDITTNLPILITVKEN